MESITGLSVELKGDVRGWEGEIANWACSLAQQLAKNVLEHVDEQLLNEKDQSLHVEGRREHRLKTVFGDVTIRRRLYQDSNGNSRFLLDEKMGLDKGSHLSPKIKEIATFVASHLPFLKSELLLRALLPSGISHTTIHRLVGKLTRPYIEAEEREVEEVFAGGVIPESEGKVVPHLFVEADGTSIALQREATRRAEMKIGIGYEGWAEAGTGRYKLKDKTIYTGLMGGDRFWEGFSLLLAKKYDLSQIGDVIVGGDGAPWVKEGAELLGGIYQLDKFHLKKALRQALAQDPIVAEVYQAAISGQVEKADRLLMDVQETADADRQKEIMGVRGYLMANSHGLRDYRLEVAGGDGLRGLGAIEGNVDKILANRMKKRGMSWRINGAQAMAWLIRLRETGQLVSWVPMAHGPWSPEVSDKTRSKKKSPRPHPGAWLQAGTPAVQGPHQNRPWVQALRALTSEILDI